MKVFLLGEKIKGPYALVRTSSQVARRHLDREKWLLIKKRGEGADRRRRPTSTPARVGADRPDDRAAESKERGRGLSPVSRGMATVTEAGRFPTTSAAPWSTPPPARPRGSRPGHGQPGGARPPVRRRRRRPAVRSAPRPSRAGGRCHPRSGRGPCWRCATSWWRTARSSPRWSPPTWARPWPTPTGRSAAGSSRSSRRRRSPTCSRARPSRGLLPASTSRWSASRSASSPRSPPSTSRR